MVKIKIFFVALISSLFHLKSNCQAQNLPPEISVIGEQVYCVEASTPIVTSASISDPDPADTTLEEVFVQIAEGYEAGQDILTLEGINPNITSIWNASEGQLTLIGPATFAEFEYAIENVFFTTSQTVFTQNRQLSINLGNANYLPSTGHYYFYVADAGISWTQARDAAAAQTYFGLQGYLATITTEEESQLAGEQTSGTGWIGGSDQAEEGTWIWETGPEAGQVFWQGTVNGNAPNSAFSFWNTNEPNNQGNEDYAHITSPSIGILGSWNDLQVTGDTNPSSSYHPQGYIIEFGGMPNEPQINLSTSSTIIMPRVFSNDVSVCGGGNVSITVSANTSDVLWYETSTATTPINTGLTYQTSIMDTTTYWLLPYVENCTNTSNRFPVTVTVNETPQLEDITIVQCDDEVIDGISNFNLSAYTDAIVSGNLNNISLQFFENPDFTSPIEGNTYTNQNNNQTIYVLAIHTSTNCSASAEVLLSVHSNSNQSAELTVCDNIQQTGLVTFNLSQASNQILSGEPTDINVLNYFETYNDALWLQNQLSSNYTNLQPYNQTIYARLEQNGSCYSIAQIDLIVEELPNLKEDEEVYYCLNTYPETITLDGGIIGDVPNNYYYNWSTGETTIAIEVNEPGTYTVEVNRPNGCTNQRSITVLPSNTATVESIDVVDIADNNTVTVLVSGEGEYVYTLDDENGIYQESNSFTNVLAGIHTVYIKDIKNNCGTIIEDVAVVGFPKFFTPNDDTVNDTWQISGFYSDFPFTANVKIFDRHGKLITVLNQNQTSWDGTYNGKPLNTDDYWFVAHLLDGRSFKGHFTLKR